VEEKETRNLLILEPFTLLVSETEKRYMRMKRHAVLIAECNRIICQYKYVVWPVVLCRSILKPSSGGTGFQAAVAKQGAGILLRANVYALSTAVKLT
jgi:hypothetical protein